MNSQFSYELDERQIRILMQSGELNFTEAAWQRFETTEKKISHSKVVKFVPNINLNFSINRSVIIPIFFISLIGGMSLLLFSFVDFKKKPEVITEKPLVIPEPTVQKPVTVADKKTSIPVKTTAPIITTTPQKEITSNTTQSTIDLKTLENRAIEASKKSEATTSKSTENKPIETAAITKTENKTVVEADTRQNKTNSDKPKKKRKRRMVAEELPTINAAPSSLSSQDPEPELDLK